MAPSSTSSTIACPSRWYISWTLEERSPSRHSTSSGWVAIKTLVSQPGHHRVSLGQHPVWTPSRCSTFPNTCSFSRDTWWSPSSNRKWLSTAPDWSSFFSASYWLYFFCIATQGGIQGFPSGMGVSSTSVVCYCECINAMLASTTSYIHIVAHVHFICIY